MLLIETGTIRPIQGLFYKGNGSIGLHGYINYNSGSPQDIGAHPITAVIAFVSIIITTPDTRRRGGQRKTRSR